jgi:hypothetical protein
MNLRFIPTRVHGISERTYGGVVVLALSALGAGALILFLLRRTRGDAREEVEGAPEAASSGVEEYSSPFKEEAEPQEAVEHPADQEEDVGQAQEEGIIEEEVAEERKRTVREFVRRLEEHSASHAGVRESADEQITVVGVLAKMGEAFEETGGGRFILSSEDEGNFDLRGKEDELDDVYQQQIQARVVGRIVDEESQPRKMEVDEVEPV